MGSAFLKTMSRQRFEPKIYHNQVLMDDFNKMMIRIKAHLFHFNDMKTSDIISPNDFPKPTVQELDEITNKIFGVLKADNGPMIKR